MRRILAFLITLVLAASLISCGNKEDPGNNKGPEGNIPGGNQSEGVDTPIIDIT